MSSDSVLSASQLPTGMLTVTMKQFRSLGALTQLQASLSDWSGFHTRPGVPMPEPAPTLTLDGNNVTICSNGPIRLIFNLPDPRYLLIGAAWQADAQDSAVGEKVFPSVFIERDSSKEPWWQPVNSPGSYLTVTDNAQNPGRFEYVLLIQDAVTGEIGMFDPSMDNESEA